MKLRATAIMIIASSGPGGQKALLGGLDRSIGGVGRVEFSGATMLLSFTEDFMIRRAGDVREEIEVESHFRLVIETVDYYLAIKNILRLALTDTPRRLMFAVRCSKQMGSGSTAMKFRYPCLAKKTSVSPSLAPASRITEFEFSLFKGR